MYDDPANESYASVTFQLLTGAVALAGGCLEHVWRDDGMQRIEHAVAQLSVGNAEGSAFQDLAVAEGPSSPGVLRPP